ncbi:VPS10 domain-containing receptor SorCS3 [Acipenser ruthenus]|uniref:VPS10 domain-containing receptor SorCS3 n=1 Tax=Acipenser ruthenus TaxID=7906 RepID=A0A444TW19_ACIRT|nr:VPS10 domain-containing receptor SorCS3 [Acipenser ruthenus]
MERGAGSCPGLHSALWTCFLISACFLIIAKGEITCTSCPSPATQHRRGVLLDLQMDAGKSGTRFLKKHLKRSVEPYYSGLGVAIASDVTGVAGDVKAMGSGVIIPQSIAEAASSKVTGPGIEEAGGKGNMVRGQEMIVDVEKPGDLGQDGGEAVSDRGKFVHKDVKNLIYGDNLLRAKRSRSSTPLDGEQSGERKTALPSQDGQRLSRAELKWTRDDGKVTNSRQEELKLTSTTFALTGDSAHNQAMVHWSGHNSSVILILTKLYDFNLGSVTESSLWRSVIGLDKESDLIHMEARTADGHTRYIICRIQACSELDRSHPFPGFIDTSSLVVQDDYMFIQVTTGGRATYYVSYRRETFIQIKLPKYALPKDMHIISTDENQVFAAVQEWYQNDTYNLYISETRGIYFTLALEHVKTSRGLEGNIMIDLYEVAGIKGMFIANKKLAGQVKTYITYNKGRDWRLLKAPVTDLRGNPIHCVLPFCSLHLHLQVSENPYTSGSISSKASAPGIIVATGNIGAALTFSDVGMFITTDAGNSWRQIFEEEHSIWFLDKGGALIAVKQTSLPIRQLAISFDEGKQWIKYSFTLAPLFVDGVLVEPGMESQIMTFFGHFSHRSEWQLVKIDYKSIFSRRCTEGDYQTWHLNNQGEPCVMGEKQIYMKRRPGNHCMLGKDYSRMLSSEPCICAASDFECDYGYERHGDGKCLPAFWFNPTTVSRSCSLGQSYLNSTGYRKVVSNNCTAGVKEIYTARKQQCPHRAPRGLHVVTSDGKLVSSQGSNVTFLVFMEDVSPVEHIHLSVPIVAIKKKEVNLTAVVWPSHSRTITYFWWFENNTEPVITLEGSVSYTFTVEGMNTVTVQVSAGDAILQDTKTIAVHEFFKSLLLSFSPNLDEYNPDIPEWRDDVSKVIKKALVQVSDFPEEQLLVAVLPGIPTAAELFLLPHNNLTEGRKKNEADLEQISGILVSALNQNVVEFKLKPGVGVIVYITQLTLAPLVDSSPRLSSSAMLMLLSVVILGLAVFLIYKFKRKIPWINIYADVNHEKEQEMIGSVSETTPTLILSEFTSREQQLEKKLETRVIGNGFIYFCIFYRTSCFLEAFQDGKQEVWYYLCLVIISIIFINTNMLTCSTYIHCYTLNIIEIQTKVLHHPTELTNFVS